MKDSLSYLGPDVEIEGKVSCDGPIRIDGTFRGIIDGQDSVTVGTSAQIFGTVRAQTLVINGQIEGDLITSGTVAILSQGDIEGKIFSPAGGLSIALGGIFQGGLRTNHMPDLPKIENLLAPPEQTAEQADALTSPASEESSEDSASPKDVKRKKAN
ncbi:MAG: polymer-forming cytoskeletal protein [SAR324 cluster bacterium]|nr:polymer-forming cytoskeletal protein [SAR324 cluster bacterium]